MADTQPISRALPKTAAPDRRGDPDFFQLALLCLAIGLGGFAPSYWLRLPRAEFDFAALVHLHAIVFTAWLCLVCLQAWLVRKRQLSRHRAFGLVGISLATMMLALGLALANAALNQRLAAGDGDTARAFLIVSFSQVLLFFGLFVAAIANIQRPDWHKRLIIAATLAALGAAIQRILILLRTGEPRAMDVPAPPVFVSLYPGLVVCGILVTIILWEWRSRTRPHPAWLIALLATFTTIVLRIPVSRSDAWLGFAQWFADIGGT